MWCFHPKKALDICVDGEVKEGRVVSVDDTNSIKIDFKVDCKMYTWKCKFNGIILPVCKSNDRNEKFMGRLTRSAIREKMLGKLVKVTCGKFDADKKLAVDIHVDGESMIEWLSTNEYIIKVYK